MIVNFIFGEDNFENMPKICTTSSMPMPAGRPDLALMSWRSLENAPIFALGSLMGWREMRLLPSGYGERLEEAEPSSS